MSVYDGIMQGLGEALEHTQGKRTLRATTIRLEPLKTYDGKAIRQIRHDLEMSQSIFACMMGVSPKTVEAWESGRNTPDGPARRLLSMIETDPKTPELYSIVAR